MEVFCRFTVTDTTVTEGDRPAVTVTAEDAEQQVALTWATEIDPTTLLHLRAATPQRQPLTIGRFQRTYVAGRPDFDASLLLNEVAPRFHRYVRSCHPEMAI